MFSERLERFRNVLAEEMTLPDFKGRHFFTAKLRIILYVGAWIIFLGFYPKIWTSTPLVPFLINLGFFITSLCYWHVLKYNQVSLVIITFELFADVMCQVVITYMLGLDSWAPYLIFTLYLAGIGILSGFWLSLLCFFVVLACYGTMLILVRQGVIPLFYYPYQYSGPWHWHPVREYLDLIFLPTALAVMVYGVRISTRFNRIKEQAVERRNIQLTAINHIGATIRKVNDLKSVIDDVLKAVIQGLGFEVCILALVDRSSEKVNFYVPQGNVYTQRMAELFGVKIPDMVLPAANIRSNSAFMAIRRNKVLVRNDLTEMMYGIKPDIPVEKVVWAQRTLGFRKFVVTPLVAEQRVVGALVGASTKNYVEDAVIDTLDNFANQAALAIESAQLFVELENKNQALIEANKIKSEFLAIMSHELRTPLNAVIGYTEILIDDMLGSLNGDQRKSLSEVLRNAHGLLDLINNILDLAKLESGKMELNVESFDLADVVRDVQNTLVPLLAKKNHKLVVHGNDVLPLVIADSTKIRQILLNLLGNAIKFTEPGGVIDLSLRPVTSCHEAMQSWFPNDGAGDLPAGPGYLILVRDTGIGIKKENLDHIFEVFSQVDSSYTRTHQGTGLGLALSKQLVLLHAGLITVVSEYGKGTEFRILIPQGKLELR